VDVGNTWTKIARVDAGRVKLLAVMGTPRTQTPVALAPLPKIPAWVCSVVQAAWDHLEPWLRDATGHPPRRIGTDVPLPAPLDYDTPETLGPDRVVAAYGAWLIFPKGALVVDAGSAITVDWIDGRGVFRGGAIAPGLRALWRGSAEAAPSLPWVPPATEVRWPGRSTRASLEAGMTAAARGLVQDLVRTARSVAGRGPALVLTGGDAPRIAPFLAGEVVHVRPDLLLWGIACAARAGDAHDG
jgi:type III pantothenate kinase